VTTDSSGAKIGEQGHYPYGEDWYLVDTTTERLFTTYQREAESGNDYAIHRYHASSLGRFTTADPVHGASAAPQQLNRYAYVGGDPVNRRDPRGLDPVTCFLRNGRVMCKQEEEWEGGGGRMPGTGWGPGGAEPPLPGLLPGGGFGGGPLPGSAGSAGASGGGGYWGPAGPASSPGPLGGSGGLGGGPNGPSDTCQDQLNNCLGHANRLTMDCFRFCADVAAVAVAICTTFCLHDPTAVACIECWKGAGGGTGGCLGSCVVAHASMVAYCYGEYASCRIKERWSW